MRESQAGLKGADGEPPERIPDLDLMGLGGGREGGKEEPQQGDTDCGRGEGDPTAGEGTVGSKMEGETS